MPSPLRRPELLRISETERCPNMTARIDNGNANRKRPQTKLAIALPLVCAGKIVPSAGGPNAGAGAEAAETSFPQTAQNLSPTDTLFPQPEQNTTISPPETQVNRRRIVEIVRNSTPRIVAGQSVSLGYPPRLADRQFGNLDPHSFAKAAKYEATKQRSNVRIENLYDVVVVDSQPRERSRSQEVAEDVANFKGLHDAENRPYL